MKKQVVKIFNQKQTLIIVGLVVSLLILQQSNMYSFHDFQKMVPNIEEVKENVSNHVNANSQSETRLTNGNFIASYITIVSSRPSKSENENCKNQNTIATIKNKVVELFSSI